MRRPLLAAMTVLAALLALPAVAPAQVKRLKVGMTDQTNVMWGDARYQALGLKHARLIVPYDVALSDSPTRQGTDRWMRSAQAGGVEALVSFNHRVQDECPRRCKLPSVAEFTRAFRAFRLRYPSVRVYNPWNEANHETQPTWRRPDRAASFFNVIRQRCPTCTIQAADVLDSDNMISWIKRFRKTAKNPRIWGIHSYGDTNDPVPLSRTRTARLLREVPGEVWLTETGGIVQFKSRRTGRVTRPYNEARAGRAVRKTFKVARISPRITRVYLYHWLQGPPEQAWDSAFVRSDAKPRPSLRVLREELRRMGYRLRNPRDRAFAGLIGGPPAPPQQPPPEPSPPVDPGASPTPPQPPPPAPEPCTVPGFPQFGPPGCSP